MSDAALEAGDEALGDLYENAPCGYLSTTVDGVVVRVNGTFLRWSGFDRDDLLGRTFTSLLTMGSQLFYETRFLSVLHLSGEVREVALSIKAADGRSMPLLVNATTIAGSSARGALIRMAIFDSTGRQDYERDLLDARRLAEASEKRVRLLQDAAAAFAGTDTEVELATRLAESVRTAFSATHSTVHLVDELGELHDVAVADEPGGVHALGPASEVIRTASPVTLSRSQAAMAGYPGLAAALRSARFESVSVIPILDEGVPIGVVAAYFGREREVEADELDLQLALARVAAQVLARQRLQRQLERLALYDQLTGLANRKLLRERLGQALETTGREVALLVLDLDGFKAVNDEFGHTIGDRVLSEIGRRLTGAVRGGDLVGRFGGDEFVVICDDTDAVGVTAVAERIRTVVREPLESHPATAVVTASIGVARLSSAHGRAVRSDEIFDEADSAMYRSKQAGGDRVTIVDLTPHA